MSENNERRTYLMCAGRQYPDKHNEFPYYDEEIIKENPGSWDDCFRVLEPKIKEANVSVDYVKNVLVKEGYIKLKSNNVEKIFAIGSIEHKG